ncbi:hypothetical protein WN48_05581 [Eufriesea mexicana]|uniref:UMA domain-containing protein n=1 Tax=Eufriesea mexicana TaxID=516756 RepID=A0A310SMD3_9HYME|nr:PREDICTED: uncharacterized protein LOC108550933 [Eufriesea mexicana]XP_017760349.1 PREDICTED: uncharacterized protein LOC108550933 [Eufriesea mexicana]OAD55106.1 hypothetical protein WN48_05581 [Eufriesea mexicana]
MSWFFGRRKQQKQSPPYSTEEKQTSEQDDGIVFVEKWPEMVPTNKPYDTVPYPSGNIYPCVPEFEHVLPAGSSKDINQGENTHYLNGVPFKLCRRLEINMNNDFEIDKLRISEILSFIERIKDQNYDYSFSVEESIIAEMNCITDK